MKLKISEIAGPYGLYFYGKIHKCFGLVLGFFPDLFRITQVVREEAISFLKINKKYQGNVWRILIYYCKLMHLQKHYLTYLLLLK